MAKQGTLTKGELINNTYEIKVLIGEGAFGEAYRVKHKHLGTQVLKLIKAEQADKMGVEEIIQEAQVLSRITHPNVVRVFEANSFERDGRIHYYLTMEFVSGESLTQYINREGVLPLDEAIKFQNDYLQGLNKAHCMKPPVIHRDINGDNILIAHDDDGKRALLSDFGLAQVVDPTTSLGHSAGRMPYWGPECFHGNYFPESDVFSAGVVFYRMLTGFFPWNYDFYNVQEDYDEMSSMVLSARKKKQTKPSDFCPNLPSHVEKVLDKSLHADFSARYRNADEFLADLNNDHNSTVKNRSTTGKTTAENKGTPPPRKKKHIGGFSDIIGMQKLKETLEMDILGPLEDKETYEEYGITAPNGMLLYGPPGCGKTFISQKLADEVSSTFIEVKPSELSSPYAHGGKDKIGKLFERAISEAPTIIFIDEIDAVLPSRENNLGHTYSSEVNEFLVHLNNCGEKGLFIIGATNRPDRIDSAILRTGRIDKKIYCPPPDHESRFGMFEAFLKNRPTMGGLDYDLLASRTECYVSSDIQFIVNEASKAALKERTKIEMSHLNQALQSVKSSLTVSQIEEYRSYGDEISTI
jgi:transitional endoplasmic reticulum ATPase